MTVLQILVLAVVQGACEMLPVSSSAHVILVEKVMGLDPSAPAMTFLLVMLHTGTMLAVIAYFWKAWRARYFASRAAFAHFAYAAVVATALTGAIGLALMLVIERVILGPAHAEVEQLFGNIPLIAAGLAFAGVFIAWSGWREARSPGQGALGTGAAAWIGAVQGLCLPFRGFSRSGATISTGLLLRLDKTAVEDFSFALAVILTPPVIAREAYRLFKANAGEAAHAAGLFELAWPSLLGMVLSFLAALAALRWLSRWLEHSQWHWFGYYCLFAAAVVFAFATR